MLRSWRFVACTAALLVVAPASVQADVRDWARRHAVPLATVDLVADDADLEAVGRSIGAAPLVAFGESAHATHEFAQMRNRLFTFLVEKKGFRAIVIESGLIEGRLVERYIHGDPSVTLRTALLEGFTHGMGPWEEVRALVDWMKAFNERQRDEASKVHFYGMDLPQMGDALITPLDALAPALREVDPEYFHGPFQALLALARKANEVTERVGRSAGGPLDPDSLDGYASIGFDQLTGGEKAALSRGLGDLPRRIDAKAFAYRRATSLAEYRWTARLAVVARQMLRDLTSRDTHRSIPGFDTNIEEVTRAYGASAQRCGTVPAPGAASRIRAGAVVINCDRLVDVRADRSFVRDVRDYLRGRETRERSLAENVAWVKRVHRKALVFAHNGHVMKAGVEPTLDGRFIGSAGDQPMGRFLAKRFGRDFVAIGGTMDVFVAPESREALDTFSGAAVTPTAPCHDCLEGVYNQVADDLGSDIFFLDMRTAAGADRDGLARAREHRWQGEFQRYGAGVPYDALVFIRRVRPASRITSASGDARPR